MLQKPVSSINQTGEEHKIGIVNDRIKCDMHITCQNMYVFAGDNRIIIGIMMNNNSFNNNLNLDIQIVIN